MVSFKGNMVSCLRSVQADLPMPKVVGTSFESRPRSTSSNPPKEGSARRTALSDGKSTVGLSHMGVTWFSGSIDGLGSLAFGY